MKNVRFGGIAFSAAVIAGCFALSATSANAGCVRKAAQATGVSAATAKWLTMETMVQSVSWGLWPAYVATGSVPGYSVSKRRNKCAAAASGVGVTCRSSATFCTK